MNKDLKTGPIKTLFLDIGGVLLTNGWEKEARTMAAEQFGFENEEMEARHQLVFNNYELGRITLDEYFNLVVFYQERTFSRDDFKAFMFSQSQALEGNIEFFKELKQRHQLKVITVSNEGRELNEYRIKQFKLDELFDAYISSCYVHLHKPDNNMVQLACDVSHTAPENVLYIDDRSLLIEAAHAFGLQTMHFTDLVTAKDFIETYTFHKHTN